MARCVPRNQDTAAASRTTQNGALVHYADKPSEDIAELEDLEILLEVGNVLFQEDYISACQQWIDVIFVPAPPVTESSRRHEKHYNVESMILSD